MAGWIPKCFLFPTNPLNPAPYSKLETGMNEFIKVPRLPCPGHGCGGLVGFPQEWAWEAFLAHARAGARMGQRVLKPKNKSIPADSRAR